MHRPMLVILGIGILAAIAVGILMYSTDPFTASTGIKALLFISVFILIMSVSALVLYGIAVAWHNGMRYFFANYFGPEESYFKSSFQGAVLVTVIMMLVIGLRRFGLLQWK